MRIAVLADIHGNLPAFEAALRHSRTLAPDLVVIAGDIINGCPDSAQCWDLALSTGAPIIRGNHERYVGKFGLPGAPAEWFSDRFGPVQWTVSQFKPDQRAEILNLPLELRIPELPELYFCHSSKTSDSDHIAPYTPAERLEAMFPQLEATLLVRGHNHAPAIRHWQERQIVTTGSVGLTLDGITSAQYLIITETGRRRRVEHQSVEYNVDAALERFSSTGYLKAGGPMARLFQREVATAAFQIVPFMRAFERWSAAGPMDLGLAVDRFLSMY